MSESTVQRSQHCKLFTRQYIENIQGQVMTPGGGVVCLVADVLQQWLKASVEIWAVEIWAAQATVLL